MWLQVLEVFLLLLELVWLRPETRVFAEILAGRLVVGCCSRLILLLLDPGVDEGDLFLTFW